LAGLVIPVIHTAANGLPLGAEINDNYVKYLYLDSGLLLRILSMDIGDIGELTQQILIGGATDLVNRGYLAEMVAGLELLRYQTPTLRHDIYFWIRAEKNSMAEVDYLIVRKMKIVPIEIKAGVKGGMKSLFNFIREKKLNGGIRSSLKNFGQYTSTDNIHIEIYPLYALSNLYIIRPEKEST